MKTDSVRRYSAITVQANQDMQVHLNGYSAIIHNKFMVFDSKNVQTACRLA